MKNYCINVALLLFIFCAISCSKENEVRETQTQISENTTEKRFVYNENEYVILFDKKGNFIPSEQSGLLENTVSEESDLTGFSFLGREGEMTYLFNSEMEGYKYYEENIDKKVGRKLQVGHATNLLRDKLTQKYGVDINYNDPQIYAETKAGIEYIYKEFKIVGTPPRDVESFMGKRGVNNARNNNSWRLWEDNTQNGDMFNLETEPNVQYWVHGNWNCNETYAAMYLDWNYRQNNQSWDDCISSFCFNFQPGADAVAYGVYKDGFLTQGGCKKLIFLVNRTEWDLGYVVPCQNTLTNVTYGGLFCSNMHDNISSLRMQTVWSGCLVDFHDF